MSPRFLLPVFASAFAAIALAAPTPTGGSNAKPLDDAAYDAALDDATGALIRQKRFFTPDDLTRAAKTRFIAVKPHTPEERAKPMRSLYNDTARATLILSIKGENDDTAEATGNHSGTRTLAAAGHAAKKAGRNARRHKASSGEATGFIIHESGIIVTCLHALPEDKSNFVITACTVNGRILPIRDILLTDAESDIAILKTDPAEDLGVLPLASDIPAGEPIRVLGHPWYRYFHMTDGIVARHSRTEPDETGPDAARAPRIDITADIVEGSSGAPVIDSRGAVVGMAHSYVAESDDEGVTIFKHRTAVPAAAILGKLRTAE